MMGTTKWQEKHKLCSYTCITDPLVLEMAQKVVKSVDNTAKRSCETLYNVAALFNSQQG